MITICTPSTPESLPIQRVTFGLGQPIAIHVSGDSVTSNNGTFYLHTDHLGSTSYLTKSTGGKVSGSDARYQPFGPYRTTPTQTITDTGYTGQHHNPSLGLIYYNARYYAPALARFISPDTVVPDKHNPQSYNRFSYVRNQPLRFTDPSGYTECDSDGVCTPNTPHQPITPPPPRPNFQFSLSVPTTPCGHAWCPPTSFGLPVASENFKISGFPYNSSHKAIDLVAGTVYSSTTGIVRVADGCTLANCNGATDTNPPERLPNESEAEYQARYNEWDTARNYGVGTVVIIEYLYESLPYELIVKLGLEPGQSLYIQYQHLDSMTVSVGQIVSLGDVIGQAGNTGNSYGDHLHLEVKVGNSGALGNGGTYDLLEPVWSDETIFTSINPSQIWGVIP